MTKSHEKMLRMQGEGAGKKEDQRRGTGRQAEEAGEGGHELGDQFPPT